MKKTCLWAAVCGASLLGMLIPSVPAQEYLHWVGGTGSWFTPTNWNSGNLPDNRDNVRVYNGGTVIVNQAGATGGLIQVGYSLGARNGHMLIQTGADMRFNPLDEGFFITEGTGGASTGTVHMTGGYMSTKNFSLRQAESTFTMDGGTVDVSGTFFVSQYSFARSTLYMNGGALNVTGLAHGDTPGSADVFQTGGEIRANTYTMGGNSQGNAASVANTLQSGGTTFVNANLTIGNHGTGTYTLSNGLLRVGGEALLGAQAWWDPDDGSRRYSSGTLNLMGGSLVAGSNLRDNLGNASIHVSGGSHVVSNELRIGSQVFGETLEYLQSGGDMRVYSLSLAQGVSNTVSMTITNGTFTSRQNMIVGNAANCNATLVIGGDAVVTNNWVLYVGRGNNGVGHLIVTNNARLYLASNDLWCAVDNGAPRTGIVTLAGGELICTNSAGQVIIGRHSEGYLNVHDGLLFCRAIWCGQYDVGGVQATGIVHVTGGEVRTRDVINLGMSAGGKSGRMTQSGGLVNIAQGAASTLWVGGATTASNCLYALNGGTLKVHSIKNSGVGTSAGESHSFEFNGGTLHLYEYYWTNGGHFVNNGGTLSPGYSGAGRTTFKSDYIETSADARIHIELGGTTQGNAYDNSAGYYDFVNVLGSAVLSGELHVSFIDGFDEDIAFSDTFTVLAAAGTISGAFGNVANGERVLTAEGHSLKCFYGPGATGYGYDANKVTLTGFVKQPDGTVFILK